MPDTLEQHNSKQEESQAIHNITTPEQENLHVDIGTRPNGMANSETSIEEFKRTMEESKGTIGMKVEALTSDVNYIRNEKIDHLNPFMHDCFPYVICSLLFFALFSHYLCCYNLLLSDNGINESVKSETNNLKRKRTCFCSMGVTGQLRKENDRLESVNEALKGRNVNDLSYMASDLNSRINDLENEKKSLITAIKLIQVDRNTGGNNTHHDKKQGYMDKC